MGPLRNVPRRFWLSGGASSRNSGLPPESNVPPNGFASSASSRKKPYARPCSSLVPLRVIALMMPPDAVPNSAG